MTAKPQPGAMSGPGFGVGPLPVPSVYGGYEILERLGEGGMAEVYRARPHGQTSLLSSVVVKRLRPQLSALPTVRWLFTEEAKLGSGVRHPNIVQVLERGEMAEGEMYIVMEYIEGTDLRWLLAGGRRRKRKLPVWLCVHVAIQMLEALSFLAERRGANGEPRPVVHCDVTPENVFISSAGQIKLGDLGVAFQGNDLDLRTSGQHRGKLPYMSPEQAACERLDPRSDVFSAAIVLWESLAGTRLIRGKHLHEVLDELRSPMRMRPSDRNSQVPPDLDAVVLSALHPHRDARIPSARVFQGHLKTILRNLVGTVQPEDVVRAMKDVLRPPPTQSSVETPAAQTEPDALPEIVAPGYVPPIPGPTSSSSLIPVVSPLSGPSSSNGITPIVPFMDLPAVPVPAGAEDAPNLFSVPTPVQLEAPVVAAPAPHNPVRNTPQNTTMPPRPPSAPCEWWFSSPAGLWGPMPPRNGFELLQRLPIDMVDQVSISADGNRWVPLARWAELLDSELVQDVAPRGVVLTRGELSDRSIVALLGDAFHTRVTGSLVLTRKGAEGLERVEIDIFDGQMASMRSASSLVQSWSRVLQNSDEETAQRLETAVFRMLYEERPVKELLTENDGLSLRKAEHLERQKCFASLVRWKAGWFRFEEHAVSLSRKPESLLAMLPFITARNVGEAELRYRMQKNLRRVFVPGPRFEATLVELGVPADQRRLLSAFTADRSLEAAVTKMTKAVEAGRAWAWSYVLVELRALVPGAASP